MKKSIAIAALSAASTSAFALIAPTPPEETKTICIKYLEDENGVAWADTCDESRNNADAGLALLPNGCAKGQVPLVASKFNGKFDISVVPCMPPNAAQL